MSEKIRELPKEQRPYEKCLRDGEQALSDAELLAVLLRSGTRTKSAPGLAGELLSATQSTAFPGLPGLIHMSVQDLTALPGIGEVKAVMLKCVAELSRRMASAIARPAMTFDQPVTIARYFMERLRHEEQEHLYVLTMDNRNHLLGEYLVSLGTATSALVSPREIFLEALKQRALGVVLVHNHPSGDPSPSLCDMEITERIFEAGSIVGIELLDHIVIGDQKYYSFREQGLIKENDI